MGPTITIIMAQAITAGSGDRMFMYSGITIMAGSIVILASEGSRAAALALDFMGADSTEGEDLLTAAAATEEEAATADDGQSPIL